jgi:hypothetical protein
MNKTILLTLSVFLMSLLTISFCSALGFDALKTFNSTGGTTDQTPSVAFLANHTSNASFSCSVYADGVAKATNASTLNNTITYLTPSLGYESYGIIVTCTETGAAPLSNSTATYELSVHEIDCSGTQHIIASILVGIFMLGILVFVGFAFASGNVDVKVIIGVAVALILMVIVIAILNPVIAGLCG